MHDQNQIEAGNNAVVKAQADRLLDSHPVVVIQYDGLHAMDAVGYSDRDEAAKAAQDYANSEVGRRASLCTKTSARQIERSIH